MAVLKRDLYRKVRGPEVTHVDRCVVQSESLGISCVRASTGRLDATFWEATK